MCVCVHVCLPRITNLQGGSEHVVRRCLTKKLASCFGASCEPKCNGQKPYPHDAVAHTTPSKEGADLCVLVVCVRLRVCFYKLCLLRAGAGI